MLGCLQPYPAVLTLCRHALEHCDKANHGGVPPQALKMMNSDQLQTQDFLHVMNSCIPVHLPRLLH